MPTAADLSTLSVRLIRADELPRWQRVMAEKHYLQSNRMVGEQLRYVAVDGGGEWLACLGWSAGCRHLSGREKWMGWTDGQRRMRLRLVANNARFLVLGARGETPNLASRVLSLNLDRLSRDWEESYGHPVLIAETFVDLQRHRADGSVEDLCEREAGACYRGVGFEACGQTRGFRRVRGGFERHGQRRLLMMREIVAGAKAMLTDVKTPWDLIEREAPGSRVDLLSLASAFDAKRGLIAHLVHEVPDPRAKVQYRWSCILGGLLGGVLAGKQTMKDIAAWARSLPQDGIQRLGGRWKKGRYAMPAANTYGYALEHADLGKLNVALRSWMQANGITWEGDIIAVDGKALIGTGGRTAQSRHTASAFSVACRAVVALEGHTGDERKAVTACLRQLDIKGCTITGDALQTTAKFARDEVVEKGLPTSSRSKRISPKCSPPSSGSTGRTPPKPRLSPTIVSTADTNSAGFAVSI